MLGIFNHKINYIWTSGQFYSSSPSIPFYFTKGCCDHDDMVLGYDKITTAPDSEITFYLEFKNDASRDKIGKEPFGPFTLFTYYAESFFEYLTPSKEFKVEIGLVFLPLLNANITNQIILDGDDFNSPINWQNSDSPLLGLDEHLLKNYLKIMKDNPSFKLNIILLRIKNVK